MRSGRHPREGLVGHRWSLHPDFGNDALDASCLVIPMVGFLPFDDERVRGTVDAIRRDLTDDNGLVYRYLAPDGLSGREGAFLLCTFWLAETLAGLGDLKGARQVFETATSDANDVDPFSEEVHPDSGEPLGDFPQAFSHVGLVNAAFAIAEAERGSDSEPGIVI